MNFPISQRIAAKLIGQDLVAVKPMGNPSYSIYESDLIERKREERKRKLDILTGRVKKEDLPELPPIYEPFFNLVYNYK